jgi:tetratricopeptide (TPR) repeat protein
MTAGEILQAVENGDVLGLILRDKHKWFAYYEYKEPDISETAIKKIDKMYTLRKMDEILDKNYSSNSYIYSADESGIKAYHARDYFFKAREYHEKKDYKNALKYYEIALSVFDWDVFYYHYGSLLMDMGDYENAERAFNKAIKKAKAYDPYTIIAPYYYIWGNNNINSWGKNNIYSFDNSGITRELYFSYYNLACMYSINNRLKNSEDNIILAIKYGYPYLDHIFADPDLKNLFNAPNAAEIKDRINQVYSAGTENTVSGKTFEYTDIGGSGEYEFINDGQMKMYVFSSDDRDRVKYGIYIVKNYHVIIYYYRATGGRGRNAIGSAGVNTAYDVYDPYDEIIDDFEYISLADMTEEDDVWGWKEKQ